LSGSKTLGEYLISRAFTRPKRPRSVGTSARRDNRPNLHNFERTEMRRFVAADIPEANEMVV